MNVYQLQEHAIEQQRERTLQALDLYRQERYRDTEVESLPQLLYCALQDWEFDDKLHHYQQDIVSLMSFLMRPSVAKLLRKEYAEPWQERISRMLLHLYDFFRCLQGEEYYTLLLKAVEIEQSDDLETLQLLQRSYRAKLAGLRVEREMEVKGDVNAQAKTIQHV